MGRFGATLCHAVWIGQRRAVPCRPRSWERRSGSRWRRCRKHRKRAAPSPGDGTCATCVSRRRAPSRHRLCCVASLFRVGIQPAWRFDEQLCESVDRKNESSECVATPSQLWKLKLIHLSTSKQGQKVVAGLGEVLMRAATILAAWQRGIPLSARVPSFAALPSAIPVNAFQTDDRKTFARNVIVSQVENKISGSQSWIWWWCWEDWTIEVHL